MKVDKENVKYILPSEAIKTILLDAMHNGRLIAAINHPVTGEVIKIHPELIARMATGESFTLEEIMSKKCDGLIFDYGNNQT